jgi:protein tyrosine/serine phosphatase
MERSIDLAGCFNFRDLGGYPAADGRRIAWRRLFRSDGLHLLTLEDVARLCDELDLRDVVDLRSPAEVEQDGRGLLEQSAVRIHHLPLFDGDPRVERDRSVEAQMTLADRYLGLLEIAQQPIAATIEVVAAAEGAAVYHCAAGKDRTGVISAILLAALGVAPEVIVADYALTNQNLDAIVERLSASEGYKAMLDDLPADTLHAEPATMEGLLVGIEERWGGVTGYLAAAGADPDLPQQLQDKLLEG